MAAAAVAWMQRWQMRHHCSRTLHLLLMQLLVLLQHRRVLLSPLQTQTWQMHHWLARQQPLVLLLVAVMTVVVRLARPLLLPLPRCSSCLQMLGL